MDVEGGAPLTPSFVALRARNEHPSSVRPFVPGMKLAASRGGGEGGRDGVGRVPAAIICQRVCSVWPIRSLGRRDEGNFCCAPL